MILYNIILNPQTLIKHRKKYQKLLQVLAKAQINVEVAESRNARDYVELTRKALEKGASHIVAVGGDGTLNLAARAFMSGDRNLFRHATLIAVDFGTGHDFYNGFVPRKYHGSFDWLIAEHERVAVSLGTYGEREKQGYFLNSFSYGISSQIVEERSLSRVKLGRSSYLLATLKAVLSYKSQPLTVKMGELSDTRSTLLFIINKGPYIGGGMRFRNDADHRSEKGHALWIPEMSMLRIAKHFSSIFKGNVATVKGVKPYDFKRLEVGFNQGENKIEVDGEVVTVEANVSVRILPDSLYLLRPLS